MEIIDISKSIVMQIEVVTIVKDVVLAVSGGHSGVGEIGSLDISHSGVEVVVALRGEEEVMVGLGLELQILVAGDEGVQEESNSE